MDCHKYIFLGNKSFHLVSHCNLRRTPSLYGQYPWIKTERKRERGGRERERWRERGGRERETERERKKERER